MRKIENVIKSSDLIKNWCGSVRIKLGGSIWDRNEARRGPYGTKNGPNSKKMLPKNGQKIQVKDSGFSYMG